VVPSAMKSILMASSAGQQFVQEVFFVTLYSAEQRVICSGLSHLLGTARQTNVPRCCLSVGCRGIPYALAACHLGEYN